MDKNKLKVLQDVSYQINKVCGMCRFMRGDARSRWGTCTRSSYTHQKHTGPDREMSVHVFGSCAWFELSADQALWLGSFQQFLLKR